MGRARSITLSLMFVHFFITNVVINIDHGTIPAAVTDLKLDLNLSQSMIGLLGSLVYIGLTAGSVASTWLFAKLNAKYILGATQLLNIGALVLFTLTNHFYLLSLSRILVGFFQVFSCIFIPVWIDIYAPQKRKTIWLMLVQLAVPLGIVLGYMMSAFLVVYVNWRWAFYAQAVILAPLAIPFFFYPTRLINPMREAEIVTAETGSTLNRNSGVSQDFVNPLSLTSSMKKLIKNEVYLYLTLACSSLYFVITGIQFWITDYMITAMEIPPSRVFLTFAVCCVSGPCLGILVGGTVVHNMGGYAAPKVLSTVGFVGLLVSCVGIPIPFTTEYIIVTPLLWLVLFLGGFMVPAITGMILNEAPRELKAISNSFAFFCYNLLGYLPAPFLYGIVQNVSGQGQESRYGMGMLMFWTVIGNVFLQLAQIKKSPKQFPDQRDRVSMTSEQSLKEPLINTKYSNLTPTFDEDENNYGFMHTQEYKEYLNHPLR